MRGLSGKLSHFPSADKRAKYLNLRQYADVAELVDARDLKSLDGNVVWVRVPPPAPLFDRGDQLACDGVMPIWPRMGIKARDIVLDEIAEIFRQRRNRLHA